MKEPVDHILRPRLPWRSPDDAPITECGYDATKVQTITRYEYREREKDLGQQRTAMMTCMTCSDTVRRWGAWEDDPRLAVGREIDWERPQWGGHSQRGHRLQDELLVINDLIEMHRADFDRLLRARADRRAWLAQKAAHEAKAKTKTPPGGGIL